MGKDLKLLGKSIPEAQYVKRTLTIRDMELPTEATLTKQSLLRWFALSLGLLSEKESRSTMVPILDALLYFQIKEGKSPRIDEIKSYLDSEKWGMRGKEEEKEIPEKAIRYHMGKLVEAGIVGVNNRRYSFVKNPQDPRLSRSIRYVYETVLTSSLDRVDSAFNTLIKMYE